MKKVVTVTLGSSKQDFEFTTQFLGQSFSVSRMGADQDTGKAWELMRRQQATVDAIGLGEIPDHYQVGLRTVLNKETQHLLNVVTRVPVTTGATLRRLLQVRIEDAVAGISGVKNVSSTISDGLSATGVEFRMEVTTDKAVQDVKDAIDGIAGDLPADVETPNVTRIDVEGQADRKSVV